MIQFWKKVTIQFLSSVGDGLILAALGSFFGFVLALFFLFDRHDFPAIVKEILK